MDSKRFYDMIRASLFGGRLSQTQVNGLEAILRSASDFGLRSDIRQLAYVLATAYHETARRMVPVRETLAPSDDEAIARLEHSYGAGKMPQVKLPYWRRDDEGKSWLGRGLVQITHKRNYQLMGIVTGYDLVRNPNLALDPKVSVAILLLGMRRGCFTGYKLETFFNGDTCDWIGARKIVNGTDRAVEIATVATAFYDALQGACIDQKVA
jgi:hypothetical protein